MPGEDRDRLFEKALAQQLRQEAAYGAAACLDPETLAAYHERLLSAEEMSMAKNHLVRCARCQEILAQLEATQEVVDLEDQRKVPVSIEAKDGALRDAIAEVPDLLGSRAAAPAAAKGKVVQLATKRSAVLRWAAPVGAIAAALLLWVGVSEFRTQHGFSEQAKQVAESRSENGRRQESEPASPSFKSQKNQAVARDELKEQAAASPRSTRKSPSEEPGSASALNAPLGAESKTEKKSPAAPHAITRELADAAKPSSGFAVGSGEAPSIEKSKEEEVAQAKSDGVEAFESRRDTLDADKKLQAAGALSGAAAAPPPAPSAKAKQSAAESVEVSSANVLSKDANDRAYSTVALAGGLATPFSVEAPGGRSVWRFGDQGAIFHSKNSGKAWESQISGVTRKLVAGSAPSEKVCWIAGANGTLLRTTNGGKHWQLVITPISGDLGGVQATDANHASIWDAPNRASYQTADGGVTWQRTANQ